MTLPAGEDHAHDWRHQNVGRLLLNGFRHFEAYLLQRLQEQGYSDVRPVHLSVMRQMDIDGTRITTIAERARITKQAISQFVGECESLDLIERRPDPTDGRAKMVCFTARGLRLIEDSQGIFAAFEADVIAILGRANYSKMKDSLAALDAGFSQRES
jgi:DNA-binding MarR family transcriptional regulator